MKIYLIVEHTSPITKYAFLDQTLARQTFEARRQDRGRRHRVLLFTGDVQPIDDTDPPS